MDGVREVILAGLGMGVTTIISGGAVGVDRWAADAAREHGLQLVEILPDWNAHGKAAGIIRNREIVRQAEAVVAFWDGKSKGTRSTIEMAAEARKLVRVFVPAEWGHR